MESQILILKAMKNHLSHLLSGIMILFRAHISVVLACTSLIIVDSAWGEEPEVADILEKTLKTMSEPRPDGLKFFQTIKTESYDSDGAKVEVRIEKFLIGTEEGEYQADLIQVNGKTATESDKKDTRKRMSRFVSEEEGDSEKEDEKWDAQKMLERFDIDLIGKREWQGRPVFQLDFEPKSGYSGSSMRDKFLSKLKGRVFVDCEEFEIAKLQIRLMDEVEIWKGILGKARKLKVDLERTRLAPGIWAEQSVETQLDFRMLLKSTREKSWIESHDFQLPDSHKSASTQGVE